MPESAEREAPYESITKLQAAERQLRVAIRLFFKRRDLVAVHTLAAAAQELLRDLGRPRGIKSTIKDNDLIRPEYKKVVLDILNEPQNFFKHADRDPNRQLKFYYEATPFFLLDAALLYIQITDKQVPEVLGIIGWSIVKFPNILVEGPIKTMMTGLIPRGMNPDNYELILAAIDSLLPAP
jgi:hypothetical protein